MSAENFRKFVKGFVHMGYGAMIQIVSEEWYKSAIKKGDPIEGVLVGQAVGNLSPKEREQALHELSIMTGIHPPQRKGDEPT